MVLELRPRWNLAVSEAPARGRHYFEGMTDETDTGASDGVGALADATLGGYVKKHDRPPAFEGSDGRPYTVSLEVERSADLRVPWGGFLVFPCWAETGLGIVGHLETPALAEGRTREDVLRRLEDLPLLDVKRLLEEAIMRRGYEEVEL